MRVACYSYLACLLGFRSADTSVIRLVLLTFAAAPRIFVGYLRGVPASNQLLQMFGLDFNTC